jgi:hypothetical protein
MSYHDMPAIGGQVGDEGLESFSSDHLFHSLKPILANQLGAHTGAELPISQVVALLIERWDVMTSKERRNVVRLLKP